MCARRKSEPTNTTPDESKKWNGESGHDRPLREILYLDFNRITSYLSQLHNGLTEYFERVESSNKGRKNPTAEAQLGYGIFPAGVKFQRGGTDNADTFTTVQRQILHHAALGAFEEILEQRDILGGLDSGKPFLKVTGNPFFLDYQEIAKNSRATVESPVNTRTDEEKFQSDIVYSSFEQLGKRMDVYFYEEKIAGPLQRDFMLVESSTIEGIYGIPLRAPTTFLALDMTATPVSLELPSVTDGSTPYLAMTFQRTHQEYVGRLSTYDENHKKVAPIAVFIDIDSGKA